MYLRKLKVRNFRCFDDEGVELVLNKGVNAIIGENNLGKSAIMDAIRISLSVLKYRKELYFNMSDFHVNAQGIMADTATVDLYFEDVPNYLIEIWDPEKQTQGEIHIRFSKVKTKTGLDRIKYDVWGGKTEENTLSNDVFDAINIAYLGALRDAEQEMKPSRRSRLAALFSSIVKTDEARNELVKVMSKANETLRKKNEVLQAKNIINRNLFLIEQDVLQQIIDIGLAEPKFESIASSLRMWIQPRRVYIKKDKDIFNKLLKMNEQGKYSKFFENDEFGMYVDLSIEEEIPNDKETEIIEELKNNIDYSFELFQNGLGYNNLIYMSTVLGDMSVEKKEILCNLLLIEEPEAHLHPQLQKLIHNFFEESYNDSSNIQVIYTSHSSTLVSKIAVDNINVLFERNHKVYSMPIQKTDLSDDDKIFLRKYLDVTKSQLFFAKGVIFVEGISEAILIPEMAKLLNRDLDKYAVEIVNINGVSFKPFANLLKSKVTRNFFAKTSIVTDDDRCTDKNDIETHIPKDIDYDYSDISNISNRLLKGRPSTRFNELVSLCDNTGIKIYGAMKTLEFELAKENAEIMLEVLEEVFPQAGVELSKTVNKITNDQDKATCIWLFIRTRERYKGEISQVLAKKIESERKKGNYDYFKVPKYIREAIYNVTEKEIAGEING